MLRVAATRKWRTRRKDEEKRKKETLRRIKRTLRAAKQAELGVGAGDTIVSQIWLRSNACHMVCMTICTVYTVRDDLHLPGKRLFLLHRKRVRAELIFDISKANIRAAMRPPLSLHMQLTEDAGLESRGCAALHGIYCVQAPRTMHSWVNMAPF